MFLFPNVDALHWALTSGVAPTSVSLAPARARREPSGAIQLSPTSAVPEGVSESLQQFGIEVVSGPPSGELISHWLQAIPLIRDPNRSAADSQTAVLFEGVESVVAELAREILRLGNDRQSLRWIQSESSRSTLLHVLGPPYFSLLQAIDRTSSDGPCAYREAAPGVWIEFGWTHPLAEKIRPANDQMILLRPPNRWRTLDTTPFREIYEVLTLNTDVPSAEWSEEPPESIDVPLRLSAGNSIDVPEFWQLGVNGEAQIDDFVREADRQTRDRLSFAVAQTDRGRLAILRARPHKLGPPSLQFDAALPFRPFHRVPNLFVPCGATLHPPLSQELVRRLLAADPDRVTWLIPDSDGHFTPVSLPETAFRPLTDWIEHVLNRDRTKLEEWAAASSCDFAVWTSRDSHTSLPKEQRSSVPHTTQEASPPMPADPPVKAALHPRRKRRPRRLPPLEPGFVAARPASALQAQLRMLEERFIGDEGNLESPERRALWPQLGRLNAAMGQAGEAAQCWLHALWENPPHASEIAWAWVETEHALRERGISDSDVARLLPPQPATPADVRPLAAAVVWGCRQQPIPPVLQHHLPAIQVYLSKHDALLPIRAVWLTWHAITMATGSDALALARVRDRLLERLLTGGLNPDRDLPSFLRYSGSQGGDRLRTLRDRLEVLRHAIHRWSGFSPSDTLQQTSSYIDLMFAFAHARLGEAGSAQALLAVAAERLDATGHSAHRFLLEAFRWRIDQALAGKPHAGPLPPEQIEYLDQIRQDVKKLESELASPDPVLTSPPYVIERMRKESRIVDPHEELDPYWETKAKFDSTISELARLSYVREPQVLREGLRRFLATTDKNSQPEIRLRALAEALPLAARLGAAACGDLLDRVGPLLSASPSTNDPIVQKSRALLIERALLFAVHFDRGDLVAGLFFELESAISEPASPTVWEARSRMIVQSLRSLRKCGLRDESDRLLQRIADAVRFDPSSPLTSATDRNEIERTRTMLHVASGWLSANHHDRARPILERARSIILAGRDIAHADCPPFVSLVDAYVKAAARAPLDESLQRIEELFTSAQMPRLPNTYTTHPYYSRFHLTVVESVVLSLANEEFAMGPAARRWLDDDEYLVRRRIHRDLRVALNEERGDAR
jgi:hypothetical protein